MKTIDLAGYKKSYLTVKLPELGTIHVATPTKALYAEMMSLSPEMQKIGDNTITPEEAKTVSDDVFNGLYKIASNILSANKEHVDVSVDYLETTFDADTVLNVFNAYLDFVAEVANARSKN